MYKHGKKRKKKNAIDIIIVSINEFCCKIMKKKTKARENEWTIKQCQIVISVEEFMLLRKI